MRVKILEDGKRLGIKAGEIYKAERYWLDPSEKVTLLERESDGYCPDCNQYTYEIAFWMQEQWMIIRDNIFVPELKGDSSES